MMTYKPSAAPEFEKLLAGKPERMERNLPGGPLIEEVMRARLEKGEPFAALYLDLVNLQEYNEEYGWKMGDQIIHMLAETILAAVTELGGKDDGIGHLYADDFVVLTRPERAARLAEKIVKRFDAAIPNFYDEKTRTRRYMDGMDRRGNPYRTLFIAVKIAIVTNEHRPLEHPLQVEELAEQVMGYIKQWPGSSHMFDQRHK